MNMKCFLLMLFISLTSCGQNSPKLDTVDIKKKTDTIDKFIKSIDDINFHAYKKVENSDIYLSKIREFSSSAEVYEIETLDLSDKFKTKIYLVWQEAKYTSLNLVNFSIDNAYIDETELMLMGGDGSELNSSNYTFIDSRNILFTSYYIEYNDEGKIDAILTENILKTIVENGKIISKKIN